MLFGGAHQWVCESRSKSLSVALFLFDTAAERISKGIFEKSHTSETRWVLKVESRIFNNARLGLAVSPDK